MPNPPGGWSWSTGIGSHIRAFEFLGGVPKLVIPDNTRPGMNRACRYEPDLNRPYHELAMHYGVGVLPTRPYKPRDKTYASHCTSTRPCAPLLSKGRRLSSLTPCARRGGSGAGSSYSKASLSLAG